MPKASPSSSTTYQVTSSETIFLFHHILCSLLGASVCFYFRFGLNKVGSRHPYIGDITLRFFIWNTCVLNCALMFMAKAEIASLIAIWLESENASYGLEYVTYAE